MKIAIALIISLFLITSAQADDKEFTSWMKKSDLDSYFQVLNNFDEDNDFFAKGYWITAVEGRWHKGNFEYRVKYGNGPSRKYSWYWHINQDYNDFSQKSDGYNNRGFRLVYAQSFQSATGELRYQSVWHKDDYK